jgi:hypothetical protein
MYSFASTRNKEWLEENMKVKAAKFSIFIFTIMALVSLACSVDLYGTPTSAPPTVEPSALPKQTAVAIEPTASPQQFYTEEFDTEDNNWEYLLVNGSDKQILKAGADSISMRTVGGLLVFDLQNKGTTAYATYEPFTYTDVRLDLKMDNRGTNNNTVSLICRKSDAGWYQFDIASNGLYEIFFANAVDNTVEYSRIADGGSNKIKTGWAENMYGIVCQGNTLVLNINGAEARRLDDKKYLLPEGKVGMSVSSVKDAPVIVDFYWATIGQP